MSSSDTAAAALPISLTPAQRAHRRSVVFLRWLRRIHLWVGLWGASLGLLFTTRRGAQVRRSVRHAARRAVGRPTPTVAEALDEARDSEYAHADYGVRVGAAKA